MSDFHRWFVFAASVLAGGLVVLAWSSIGLAPRALGAVITMAGAGAVVALSWRALRR